MTLTLSSICFDTMIVDALSGEVLRSVAQVQILHVHSRVAAVCGLSKQSPQLHPACKWHIQESTEQSSLFRWKMTYSLLKRPGRSSKSCQEPAKNIHSQDDIKSKRTPTIKMTSSPISIRYYRSVYSAHIEFLVENRHKTRRGYRSCRILGRK